MGIQFPRPTSDSWVSRFRRQTWPLHIDRLRTLTPFHSSGQRPRTVFAIAKAILAPEARATQAVADRHMTAPAAQPIADLAVLATMAPGGPNTASQVARHMRDQEDQDMTAQAAQPSRARVGLHTTGQAELAMRVPAGHAILVLEELEQDVPQYVDSHQLFVRPHMNITDTEGRDWRQWVLVTSIPLVRLGDNDRVLSLGSGTMIDHAGRRFLLAAEHVVKSNATGWSILVQQDGSGRMEYYRPSFFTYVGEVKLTSGEVRLLDLCVAQVSPQLETWYEYRTPRGLFDKLPHIIFDTRSIAAPEPGRLYGFSGRVRTEKCGEDAFVSDMVVYPGLSYSHSEQEVHHFKLPVVHPGHEAFHGCSGSPIVDFNRKVAALVVGGDVPTNTVQGVSIYRVLPNLEFLASRGGA